MNTTQHGYDEVKQHAVDRLDDYMGSNVEGSELHHELFNTDYYIIGIYQAKEWLKGFTFEAIEVIKQYEQDNFGEVNTDFSDPEKVVNMYVYILGEEILGESATLRDRWNNKLDDDDLKAIKEELS